MALFVGMPHRKLGDLYQKCTNQLLKGAHDAGEDAKATLTIWQHKFFQDRMQNTTLPLGRRHPEQTVHCESLYANACAKRDKTIEDEGNEMKAWEDSDAERWSEEEDETDPEDVVK